MDMYYILDSNNNLIDRNKSYMEMKVLSDLLNTNSYNGIPKRIFINQLRTISDYIQELYKNEDYGNYEIRSEWIVK